MNNHITRVPSKIDAITATAKSGQDSAVLMLNFDHYTAGADFSDDSKDKTYMDELAARCCSAPLYRANRSAAHDEVDESWPSGTQATPRSRP